MDAANAALTAAIRSANPDRINTASSATKTAAVAAVGTATTGTKVVPASATAGIDITVGSGTDFSNLTPANPTFVLHGEIAPSKQVNWTRNSGTCAAAGMC
ncbi:hypothetical protein D3C85_1607670 [compost metagenome]